MGVKIRTVARGISICDILELARKALFAVCKLCTGMWSMQLSLDEAIAHHLASPPRCPSGRFDERGIVICAGGTRYFTCAWVLISILRRVHKTALPIQVWHLGRREMSDEMRLLLAGEDIEVVDAEAIVARYPARLSG